MNNTDKLYIGIDIGGTSIKGGLVNHDGRILCQTSIKTNYSENGKFMVQDVIELCNKLATENGNNISEISGIGMGIPGSINSEKGVITYSNNLHLENVAIKDIVEKALNIPVKITNDANSATLGEAKFGASAKYKNSVLLTLGTGIGSGIIIDGKLYEGKNSAGAEIGHMVMKCGGELCTCGRRGCIESYCSVTALIRETKRAMEQNKQSIMWDYVGGDIEKVDGRTSFENAKQDETAKQVVENYIEDMSEAIANIANILRPEAILLGGGLSAQGDNLIVPIREKIKDKLFGGEEVAKVEILKATLENKAGILGAVGLFM